VQQNYRDLEQLTPLPPLGWSLEMWCWSGWRGTLNKKLSLCYTVVYCYNGAQRYEQFLQVGRLYRALILLGLALSSKRLCVLDLHGAIYMLQFFCLHPSIHLLVNGAWWDWPLMWLINHCPSVLWCCWLGLRLEKPSPKWPVMCQVRR